jgi:uncharacterized HAD superfamily protein
VTRSRLILSDCDGCLLSWYTRFEQYIRSQGERPTDVKMGEYLLSRRYGLTVEQSTKYVEQFNRSEYMSNLEPLIDAKKWVAKLAEDGFRFVVISSMCDDPIPVRYRIQNLNDVFGDVFDNVICLKQGSRKGHILEEWKDSGLFWIEDHCVNASDGNRLGLKSILVESAYNEGCSNDALIRVPAANPWEQIYNIITEDYKDQ